MSMPPDSEMIIKDGAVVQDRWITVAADAADVPEGDVILPLSLWRAREAEFVGRNSRIGIQLEPGDHPSEIADELDRFDVIVYHFPTFRDGRAYSHARLLRARYGFKGELRASGDVLREQIFFMARCGFNAFTIKDGKKPDDLLAGLKDFTVTYQNAADTPLPHFRR